MDELKIAQSTKQSATCGLLCEARRDVTRSQNKSPFFGNFFRQSSYTENFKLKNLLNFFYKNKDN